MQAIIFSLLFAVCLEYSRTNTGKMRKKSRQASEKPGFMLFYAIRNQNIVSCLFFFRYMWYNKA